MTTDQVTTRSKTKLRLILDQDQETPAKFTPPHRSTELFGENPFQRSSRTSRSPTRPWSTATGKENHFQFPPVERIDSEDREVTQINTSFATPTPPQPQQRRKAVLEDTPQEQGEQPEVCGLSKARQQTPPPPPTIVNAMANITLGQSLVSAKTPAKPKFICPPSFSPCSGSASSFIRNYERTAAANGWDEMLKIGYLDTFLEGAADLWFQRYKERAENTNKTWAEVKKDFLSEFETEDLKRVLERRLYERKQKPEESIKSYYYELQNLFGEYDSTFNLAEFRKFFENGIKRDLYQSYRLIVDENMNWDEFKIVINKLEDISHPPVGISQETTTKMVAQCSCACSHQQQNKNRYQDAQRYPSYRPRPNNFHRNFQPPTYRPQYNSQIPSNPVRNNRPTERPFQGNQGRNMPNTRTPDGRPRCYLCNRVGHYATTCQTNSQNRHPNNGGRRN